MVNNNKYINAIYIALLSIIIIVGSFISYIQYGKLNYIHSVCKEIHCKVDIFSEHNREQIKKKLTPGWANREKIKKIYKKRKKYQQVDHIVPLRSKYVHGLHVENNLQIVSAEENSHKSNKYDISNCFFIKNLHKKNIKKIIFFHANDDLFYKFKLYCIANFIKTKIIYIDIINNNYPNITAVPTIFIIYNNKYCEKFVGINFNKEKNYKKSKNSRSRKLKYN